MEITGKYPRRARLIMVDMTWKEDEYLYHHQSPNTLLTHPTEPLILDRLSDG